MDFSQQTRPSGAKPKVQQDSHSVGSTLLETLREKNISVAPPLVLGSVPTPPAECSKYFRFIVHSTGVRVLIRPLVDTTGAEQFLVGVYESLRQCVVDDKQEAILSNAFKILAPWKWRTNFVLTIASAFNAFLGRREDALCHFVSTEVVTWLTQIAFVNHMGNLCSAMFCFPSADVASLAAVFSDEAELRNQGTDLFCAVVSTVALICRQSHAAVGPSRLLAHKLRSIGFPIPEVLTATYISNFRGQVDMHSEVHQAAVQLICELLSVHLAHDRKLSLVRQMLDLIPTRNPRALWSWAIDLLQHTHAHDN